jgi:mannosyl-3-phosphoglycerate phosphatase
MLLTKPTKKILVFTDLDGTLLDHDTYSFDAAAEMLHHLKEHHIPLIIVTSKTRSEVRHLQQKLRIRDPYVVENGAGVIIPGEEADEMVPMGYVYSAIREAFARYQAEIAMIGFGDMRPEEIGAYTGLTVSEAADAKSRGFTEPFILENDSDLERLRALADSDGLEVVRGGRFYHLITRGQDKAHAIDYLLQRFQERDACEYHTIALGDNYNDLTMLAAVDTPILIPAKGGRHIPCEIEHLIHAPYEGPRGWNSALKDYFERL